MKFGDDDFVVMLQTDGDYENVYPIVDAVIRPFVGKKMRDGDGVPEEVLQEIHVAVWQALPQFRDCAEAYTPQQRLSWLYTIASNKIKDYFRETAKQPGDSGGIAEEVPDPSGDPEEQLLCRFRMMEQEKRVNDLLRSACSLGSRPENKLAFLYNRVIAPLDTQHSRKGDNQSVAARLQGQPLGRIRRNLEKDLSRVMGRRIPREVLLPLDHSLKGREEEQFWLSARQVAVGSYSVCAALHHTDPIFSNGEARGLSKEIFSFFSLIIHGLCRFIG